MERKRGASWAKAAPLPSVSLPALPPPGMPPQGEALAARSLAEAEGSPSPQASVSAPGRPSHPAVAAPAFSAADEETPPVRGILPFSTWGMPQTTRTTHVALSAKATVKLPALSRKARSSGSMGTTPAPTSVQMITSRCARASANSASCPLSSPRAASCASKITGASCTGSQDIWSSEYPKDAARARLPAARPPTIRITASSPSEQAGWLRAWQARPSGGRNPPHRRSRRRTAS